jgi:hypothetical protein
MKTILLLFLPFATYCQTVTFHDGAGINPFHIERLGPESGFVQLWVGPMAKKGEILKVWFDNWEQIDKIEITLIDWDGAHRSVGYPKNRKNENWYGCYANIPNKIGDYIRWEYKITLKKA